MLRHGVQHLVAASSCRREARSASRFRGLPPRVVDECASIGRRRGGRSAQQVALRWITQQGVPFVVHSRSASHLRDDLAAVDQPALSDDEMATLARLAESV